MRRTFAVIGFSFVFSAIIASMISVKATVVLMIIAACALILSLSVKALRKGAVIALSAAVMLSMGMYIAQYYAFVSPTLEYDGASADFTAVALDYDTFAGSSNVTTVKVICADEKDVSFKLKLYCREPMNLKPDEVICFNARLSSKYVSKNSDYGNRVYLSAYLNDSSSITNVGAVSRSVSGMIADLRHTFCEKLDEYLPGEQSALMKSLLFSDKSGLDDDTYSAFMHCGLLHAMAVSGLHMSIIAGMIFSSVLMFTKNKRKASVCGIIAAIFFTAVVGFRISAVRAAVMLIITFAGNLFSQRADSINSLGFSAALLIMINPMCAVNISFLMSFCATLGILLMYSPIMRRLERLNGKRRLILKISAPFIQSVCASIAILPLTFLFFGNVSVISPLCNMILLPLISFCVSLGVIFLIFSPVYPIAAAISAVLNMLSSVIIWAVKTFAKLPVTVVNVGGESIGYWIAASLVLCAAAYVLIMLKFGNKRRIICITALLCVIMLGANTLAGKLAFDGTVKVSLLSSGKGVCAVVDTGAGDVLVGAGGSRSYTLLKQYYGSKPGKICAAIFQSGENKYAQNAHNAVKYLQPLDVFMDGGTDKQYQIDAVYDNEIKPLNNAEITVGNVKFIAQKSGKAQVLLMKTADKSLLFIDNSADYEKLSDEFKSADIVIFANSAPKDLDLNDSKTVIYCTNTQKVADCGAKAYFSTADNEDLCITMNKNRIEIKNELR